MKVNDYHVLNVTGPNFATGGMCTVYHSDDYRPQDLSASYTVSVELYIEYAEKGHLGLMYNVQDLGNYDAIYFRSVR